MFKLLAGAAIGFAAAWFMDSTEGEQRRTMIKERASGLAGKGNGETVSSGSQVS